MGENGLLDQFVGQRAEPDRMSRYVVNEAMIRNWVEALEDPNPVYVSHDDAVSHGREGIICPPAMVSTWVMNGLSRKREIERNRAEHRTDGSAYAELMRELDLQGFTSVVATNLEQTYHREVSLGVHVRCEQFIDAVSPLKSTGLGDGHFITLRKEYRDALGEHLATETFRLLRFRPKSAPAVLPTGVPPIIRTHDNVFWFDAVAEGRLLIQKCGDCGHLRHPPGPACPRCRSFEWESIESSRWGVLHSYTVVHHPKDAAFTYPLAVGLVDLEEGTRFVADFETVPAEGLEIGAPVELYFREHAHGEMLPCVRLLNDEANVAPAEIAQQETVSGFRLPELEILTDRTFIAAGAIASQDFEDVHHDPDKAKARGVSDIFLSINTTNGLVDRYLTQWAGPQASIRKITVRLGVPQTAHMTLRLTGIARRQEERVIVDVTGANADGVHVYATAELSNVDDEILEEL